MPAPSGQLRSRPMAELEPLYTADEMRAAEAGHDVDAMMQRAGAAVAEEVMRRFPDARRIALHAGGGANGLPPGDCTPEDAVPG